MSADKPLVSIGLPTYNGDRFIASALDSLLAQDHEHIQILISDNASTDGTEAIARSYADRDHRVRYERQATNLGAIANFNHVLALASGEYFMWAADHDLWDVRYVSSCVNALQADRDAVLAYAHTMLIDEDDREIGLMKDGLDVRHPRAIDRYLHVIWTLTVCNAIYGVIRRSAVAATGGADRTPGPDHLILAKLALQGTFIQLAEPMYLRRQNRPHENRAQQRRRHSVELDPATSSTWTAKTNRDYYRSLRDGHLRAIRQAPLPVRDRVRGYLATVKCFSVRWQVSSMSLKLVARLARLLPASLKVRLRGLLSLRQSS
jgi:glycosyltransferase involved in cell wall biosynthesis